MQVKDLPETIAVQISEEKKIEYNIKVVDQYALIRNPLKTQSYRDTEQKEGYERKHSPYEKHHFRSKQWTNKPYYHEPDYRAHHQPRRHRGYMD